MGYSDSRNATLQCLLNCPGFSDQIEKDSVPTGKFAMAKAFQSLVRRSRGPNQGRAENPSDVKESAGYKSSIFRGYGQQDAHEFLVHFLEATSLDTNRVSTKPKYVELDYQADRSKQQNVDPLPEAVRRLVQLLQNLREQHSDRLLLWSVSLRAQVFDMFESVAIVQ